MRVLYFTANDSPHDRRFLRALGNTSHQIFALRQESGQPETPSGVRELRWLQGEPDWRSWRGWQAGVQQFQRVLDQVKPDLVHAGPIQGPALVVALSGFHPLVSMSWGSDLLVTAQRSPWMRWSTACVLSRTDVFLGDCQTVADAAAAYGFPRERMALFPWGVDLVHFSPGSVQAAGKAWRQRLGWEKAFVILCNRSWEPLYDVITLAKAFTIAAAHTSSLRLILAGGGAQAELIESILAPVREKVHFVGRLTQSELPAAYGAADLYVSPSKSDGSSISLLEALACGVPALVSDIPGNREWVTLGEVGDLFPVGESKILADKILRMASNQNLKVYGRRARRLAEQRADWRQNFQKLLEAYQMAVARAV